MNNFRNNVIQIWGEAGEIWLNSLPAKVDFLANTWGLQDLKPVPNLTYNYVLTGIRKTNHLPIVVKIGCDTKEVQEEATILQAYSGHGCVKLLIHESHIGALLLERILPGQSLKSLFPTQDDLALEHTVQVMQTLHSIQIDQSISKFAHVSDWLKGLHTPISTKKLDCYYLQKAQSLAQDLLQSSSPDVLLHGDLHHDNILFSSNDNWLAIDPKGVLGESLYEVGAFVRNPYPELLQQSNVKQIISSRIDLFADRLQADKQRIKAWCYVQTVLADCWAAEVSDDGSLWLAEAKIIDKL